MEELKELYSQNIGRYEIAAKKLRSLYWN